MRYAVILLCVVIHIGCVATGPIYQEPPEPKETDALVYIYRPNVSALGGRDAYFYVDDVNIVDLSSEGYTWLHLPAGEYSVKQKWPVDIPSWGKALELKVKLQPRQKYFFRFDTSIDYPGYKKTRFHWQLSEVEAVQAMMELRNCKLQPAFGMPKLLEKINHK